jgi:hypothetical protein
MISNHSLLPREEKILDLFSGDFDWSNNEQAKGIVQRYYYEMPDVTRGLYIQGPRVSGKRRSL